MIGRSGLQLFLHLYESNQPGFSETQINVAQGHGTEINLNVNVLLAGSINGHDALIFQCDLARLSALLTLYLAQYALKCKFVVFIIQHCLACLITNNTATLKLMLDIHTELPAYKLTTSFTRMLSHWTWTSTPLLLFSRSNTTFRTGNNHWTI